MGGNKIGSYSYPILKLERALEISRIICEAPYKGQISQSGLAQQLKMKERGGGFINLVGSLRDYNLVQGKGTLQATETAKRIVAGSSAEESALAKAEAFLSVPLFKQVYQRIGIKIPPEEQFSVLLGEITQEDKLELPERSKNVLKFYMEGARYLAPTEGEMQMETFKPSLGGGQHPSIVVRDTGGTLNMTVDRTPDDIDAVITVLQNLKKRLATESKANKGEK